MRRLKNDIATRYHAIPPLGWLVVTVMIFMIMAGMAFAIRRNNPVSTYLLETFGVYSEAVALIFIGFALILPIAYYLVRSPLVVVVCLIPFYLVAGGIGWQVLTSATAPLIHLVMIVSVMATFAVLWGITSDNTFLRKVIEDIKAERDAQSAKVTALQTELTALQMQLDNRGGNTEFDREG